MAVIEQLQTWLSMPLLVLGDYTLRIAGVASAIGILVVSAIVQRGLSKASAAAAKRSGAHDQNVYIIQRVLKYIVYGVGLILALSALTPRASSPRRTDRKEGSPLESNCLRPGALLLFVCAKIPASERPLLSTAITSQGCPPC